MNHPVRRRPLNVLVACEFSGVVRDAFIALGHNAVSCDVLPTERPGPHIQQDVRFHLHRGWDLLIAHPPCTYITVAGAHKFHEETWQIQQQDALDFMARLMCAPIPRICIENPVGVASDLLCQPTQIVHPWQFGHGETKRTCLWLKELPPLAPTDIVEGREPRLQMLSPSKDRGHLRSVTYQGIADAMALQWGGTIAKPKTERKIIMAKRKAPKHSPFKGGNPKIKSKPKRAKGK